MPASGRWRWWWPHCSWPTARSRRSAKRCCCTAPARGSGLDARRYGRVRLWGSMGFIVSVLLLRRGAAAHRHRCAAAVHAAACSRCWPGPHGGCRARPTPDRHARSAPPIGPVMRRPEVRWFFAGVMLTVLAHTALYAFFSLYLDQLGYGKAGGRHVVGRGGGGGDRCSSRWPGGTSRASTSTAGWCWRRWLTALRFALTAAFGSVPAVLVAGAVDACADLRRAAHGLHQPDRRHFPDRLRARGSALYTTLGYGVPGRGRRRGRRAAERALRPAGGVLGGGGWPGWPAPPAARRRGAPRRRAVQP